MKKFMIVIIGIVCAIIIGIVGFNAVDQIDTNSVELEQTFESENNYETYVTNHFEEVSDGQHKTYDSIIVLE